MENPGVETDSSQIKEPASYANMVNITSGPYDVVLTFSQVDPIIEETTTDTKTRIKSQVQLHLPMGLVKAMIPLVVKIIADYEEQHGQIPAPGFDEGQKQ